MLSIEKSIGVVWIDDSMHVYSQKGYIALRIMRENACVVETANSVAYENVTSSILNLVYLL